MKTKSSFTFYFESITEGLRPVATRLLIIPALSSALLALRPAPCALSQIPQGFNYQAIARDGSGNPISTPINVKIAILSGITPETVIWEEQHIGVDPDDHGLFSIVVGQGSYVQGLATFSLIDWTVTPKYIRTKINETTLGTSQLWSVPYAMVADSLGGPLNKLKVQASDGSSLDEALFLVKNKNGQTVFAVYNEGVRIFVGDGAVKGAKGGFSVGGFGSEKDENNKRYLFVDDDSVRIWVNDLGKSAKGGFSVGGFGYTKEKPKKYFYANEDSVRIYIDDTGKAAKGGFSVGGFSQAKGFTNFLNVSTDAAGIVDPAVNRILWYPLKNAFLTGRVLITNPLDVGENSIASGYEPKAKGGFSQAFGYRPVANGDYSTAIGKNALSGAANSFSFGDGPQATAVNSYAFGAGAVASGIGSFAFGSIGLDTLASPTDVYTTAAGNYSIAIGQGSNANSAGSVSMGLNNISGGEYSSSVGFQNTSSGRFSSSFGTFSTALADNSLAIGQFSNATGIGASAFGNRVVTSGWDAVALGAPSHCFIDAFTSFWVPTEANGDKSMALGHGVKAQSYASVVIGQQNVISGSYSSGAWIGTDPLFVIGNGNGAISGKLNIIRSNAMMVLKNGNVGLGSNQPVARLEIGDTLSTLFMNSVGSNTVRFNKEGVWAPAFFGSSVGTKIVLYPSVADDSVDYAIGIDAGTLWNSVPKATDAFSFKFYAGITNLMTIRGDGYVGIGTATPQCPLDISGSAALGSHLYGYLNASGGVGTWTANAPYSIRVSDNILAGEFHAISDLRVKEIIGLADNNYNLERLKDLSVISFSYIDRAAKGNRAKVGLIAQNVEDVIPEAVTESTNFIPDIYSPAAEFSVDDKKQMLIRLERPHNLRDGNIVRLYADNQQIESAVIVISEKEFSVENIKSRPEEVFVYGRQVNDFRSLDYNQIFIMGIGAIQELDKVNESMKQDIESLRSDNSKLNSEINDLMAENNSLKEEIEQLQSLQKEVNTLKRIVRRKISQ